MESYYAINTLKQKRSDLFKKKDSLPEESLTELRLEYENIKSEIRDYEKNRQKAYERNARISPHALKNLKIFRLTRRELLGN